MKLLDSGQWREDTTYEGEQTGRKQQDEVDPQRVTPCHGATTNTKEPSQLLAQGGITGGHVIRRRSGGWGGGSTQRRGTPSGRRCTPAYQRHGGQIAGDEPRELAPTSPGAATFVFPMYPERQIIAWLAILVGAYFLAKASVSRREKGQMRELLDLPTDKIKRFRNFFVQRLERIVGFLFILIGVGVHLYVVVRQGQKLEGPNNPREALADMSRYLGMALIFMIFVTVLMHWICSFFARKIFLELLGYLMVRQRYDLSSDPALMMQIGEMLGVQRGEHDTVESYTERIEAALKLESIRAELLAKGKLPNWESKADGAGGAP